MDFVKKKYIYHISYIKEIENYMRINNFFNLTHRQILRMDTKNIAFS